MSEPTALQTESQPLPMWYLLPHLSTKEKSNELFAASRRQPLQNKRSDPLPLPKHA